MVQFHLSLRKGCSVLMNAYACFMSSQSQETFSLSLANIQAHTVQKHKMTVNTLIKNVEHFQFKKRDRDYHLKLKDLILLLISPNLPKGCSTTFRSNIPNWYCSEKKMWLCLHWQIGSLYSTCPPSIHMINLVCNPAELLDTRFIPLPLTS